MINKFKSWLKYIGSAFKYWIMVSGTIGFCLFILEEASQVATFSTFMSKTNQDYELVLKAADIMNANNSIINSINKYIGWINPFSYISYNQYAAAQRIYADECIMFVLRNEPALLEDREVEINFTPKEVISTPEGFVYRNGKINVIKADLHDIKSMNVKGKIENGKIRYIEKALQ